ncbi:MAG: hypothetical protein M3Q68_04685 [Actinomycetota bacterium]|nr:hypothetical protein [Actinomycetota bacterium]
MLASGEVRFTAEDLDELSEVVADAWLSGAEGDWSAPAGTLEWSCRATADHAVDCVYAPAFFLASRRPPRDFLPRGALELILHAHDVCSGLGVVFEPPPGLCERLREHTRPWPMWDLGWKRLGSTDDPWDDLLQASGRMRRTPSPGWS